MKSILTIVIVLLLHSIVACSQNPKKGDYLKDEKLDKFVGIWEASTGKGTIRIILKKEKIFIKGMDFYQDMIIGWHVYSKDKKTVESSIDYAGSVYDENVTILASSEGDDILKITTFKDISRNRNNVGIFKMKDLEEGVLTLNFLEQISINKSTPNPIEAIPIPSEWVMNRIK